MKLYTYRNGNKIYVTEGDSHEEAIIKFFNLLAGEAKMAFMCDPAIVECPSRLVSTPESRELCYG